jgi:RNA polymerase sigma-70 factor, ECF subfamily
MSAAVRQVEGLYQAYGPALLVYLRRLTGRHMAEDLLQETFVQALRGIDRLSEVASPRAWLFTIARNVGISAIRRRRAVVALSDEMAIAPVAGSDPRLEKMALAINELPEKLRETLELRLRHDLSYEEIAAVLSIPLGTVRSRLHNAVKQLREELIEQ